MAIIQITPRNVYNDLHWENNISNVTEFQTSASQIPASNLTANNDNSQHDAIVKGTITGIALHLPTSGYINPKSSKNPNAMNYEYEIYEYAAAYYVNPEAISLPSGIGESVSGRLERFDVVNQMLIQDVSI